MHCFFKVVHQWVSEAINGFILFEKVILLLGSDPKVIKQCKWKSLEVELFISPLSIIVKDQKQQKDVTGGHKTFNMFVYQLNCTVFTSCPQGLSREIIGFQKWYT